MPTVYHRSRSPVRAINTSAHQASPGPTPRPRTWSEPELGAVAPVGFPAPERPHLGCPDCGAILRLALVRTSAETPWTSPTLSAPTPLRAAPKAEPLPDFEASIQNHKRELIRRALDNNSGVMTRAAKALGLKYTTFVAMVHRLGVLEETEVQERGRP